jgi:hypothetical protein
MISLRNKNLIRSGIMSLQMTKEALFILIQQKTIIISTI